ncbi:TPA: ABC transporter substrate-binding protein [Providencia rettgeri]|uniref:ABC transporter substrate-binding protein n=2 Tax=Morganellaceae TaxID=1903414 RepID=UPI00197F6CFF|nr:MULTISPECIES: ABC transporter substrate-binding protein [Providencia]MBN4866670.1 oligopeptide ABC transporter substrate-binding protein OppA [Providencia stuartii]MBN4876058.1 oligopeptide ABC transporter substrate-binding protein OppA [Providencia stuartii]MBN4880684.1 oligopeptide ABC transporter substrate-binding protein OppA [Providencia stuartii]MBN4885258.1 oligopeptide ABC transporter substrate-binding protein OppA [Providencia stuartii]HEM8290795.1 oligopeptide ABC transporter subs
MRDKMIRTAMGLGALSLFITTSSMSANIVKPVQSIVINNGSEVASLDPHKVEGVPESNVILNLLEGLVYTDVDGKVTPGVAKNWVNDNYITWIFTLRDDAKWSDGTPVTAEDFVYSWQRLADPATGSPYSSYLQNAYILNADAILAGKKPVNELGVKALDPHHLQVTLSHPVPYFVDMLSHTAMKPVNKQTIEKHGDKWTQPQNFVGNGAYLLDKWVVNERIVVKRNPLYWNNVQSQIDQATFLAISSEVSDINRYRSGETDISNSAIPPALYQKMKQEKPNELYVRPYLCTFYYEINNKRPPFNDPRVREAIKLGLDRETITNKIINQGQTVAYGFTPTFINNGNFEPPQWASLPAEQRYQRARELLAEAGYTKENPLKFSLLYNTSDQNKQQAIVAASMWQKNIGAKVTLQNQEWKTSLQSRHEGQYDVARATWCADYNEPTAFLNMMLTDNSNNTGFYSNATFDALLAQALTAQDEQARHQIYQQAEALLDKDSALVPVYYRVSARMVKPTVGGFKGKDPLDYTDIKRLYISEPNK